MKALPSIRHLEAFVAVARTQSFSRAADLTHMSQSALSQAVLEAERLLGFRLFERTKRWVKLSRAGQVLLPRAEHIITNLESAVLEARNHADPSKGRVAIACLSLIATRILPAVIQEFRKLYPDAPVLVRDDFLERVIDCVKRGEVDLAVSALPAAEPGISFEPLFQEDYYFISPRKHPLAWKKQVCWSDLANVDFVGMPQSSSVRMAVDQARIAAGSFRQTVYEVGRVTSVMEIVAQGGGVSVVPALALTDSHLRTQVHSCPITDPIVRRTIGIIKLQANSLSSTAQEFQRIFLSMLQDGKIGVGPGLTILTKITANRSDLGVS
jgi:DNA-binding transcriptional LysR family regulator